MPVSPAYTPAHRITELGNEFYDVVAPARFPKHVLRFRNRMWDARIGLGLLADSEWEAHFARFDPLPENLAQPLALRYHGHQFDVYNPYLGDGRGFLFAQVEQVEQGRRRLLDLATKGSGRTPWSRDGDGRLTLKGGVREVLATEMLEALGVRTSKSLSLFETGERLVRGDEPSPTRSSVLVRLGHSHIRFGTFQRLAFLGDKANLDRLLSYSIAHYFPDLDGPDRVLRFLARVARLSAELAASFMVAGFVHGVLNSDNMVITGESFDYGPYRFLPRFDLEFVAAYFDHQGLYAFGRQPAAIVRNLTRLAESLRPLEPSMPLAPALSDFADTLDAEVTRGVLARLGLRSNGDTDAALVEATFGFLGEADVGYDRFFFEQQGLRGLGREEAPYCGSRWNALRSILDLYTPVAASDPYFEGDEPCTLLIDEVESIWTAIAGRDDWGPFLAKIDAIRAMGSRGGSP
jgi:uncharacterized protein YdiU (UPF0061 family)